MQSTHTRLLPIIMSILVVILLVLSYILSTQISSLNALKKTQTSIEAELQSTKATLSAKQSEYDSLYAVHAGLQQDFARAEENNAELLSQLDAEQKKNSDFENQIDDISGTVGKLDKLSKIDPELLKKYSKVYFLNEHYAPEKLTEIAHTFVSGDGVKEYIHINVAPYLTKLLEDAKDDNVNLLITSAYRSFDEQGGLKNVYTVQYGTGANIFSADQGYSEHQLGTTIDFTSDEINGGLVGFQNTKAYQWLLKNAQRYGFTLSYPEGNAYYVYEPWHWRFVGEKLARDLYKKEIHFYDMDQRTIDGYLISLFD